MKFIFCLFVLCLFLPLTSQAQNVVSEPICFLVINEAPYKVFGNIGTDYYTTKDGIKARHRSNFRLDEAGSKHEDGYPLDRAEFCSYGPFYQGRKLNLVLRTLVPIFSCATRIEDGPIVIKGYRKPGGGTETWAECYQ